MKCLMLLSSASILAATARYRRPVLTPEVFLHVMSLTIFRVLKRNKCGKIFRYIIERSGVH